MKDFLYYLEKNKEYGIVKKANNSFVYCSGLPNAEIDEIIILETGEIGKVMSLDEDFVEVLILSRKNISSGLKAARTGEKLKVKLDESVLGNVIDPLSNNILGESIEFKEEFKEALEYDILPRKISDRAKIARQFDTGVSIIDMALPLGKGQRELIVGDRKTGKTSVILNIIKNQILHGSIVVYACIGKEKSEVKRLNDFFNKENLLNQSIIVATFSDDSSSLIDMTPYSAMTISEYFMQKGKDVLLIIDDLTTHAKHYREISLIGNRFPGRDSYPGDIFYKHARLLERAGEYKYKDGKTSSITCLPIAETMDSRLTDYIVSNLISITDGHLLFDIDSFNKGRRPAINLFLSVTRVGKQTQSAIARSLNRKLFRALSRHSSIESYQHFGTELSPDLKRILEKGNKIYKFFEQTFSVTMAKDVQTVFLSMLWGDLLENVPLDKVVESRNKMNLKYQSDEEVRKKFAQILESNIFETYFDALKKDAFYFKALCKI